MIARILLISALYGLAAMGLLASYLAGVGVAARAAYEHWGWMGAWSAIAGCFLFTAIVLLTVAGILRRRLKRGEEEHKALAVEATRVEDSAAPAHPLAAVIESIIKGGSIEAWIAPLALGAATLVVVGPVRLMRIAARAVRIARTLTLIAGVTGLARHSD